MISGVSLIEDALTYTGTCSDVEAVDSEENGVKTCDTSLRLITVSETDVGATMGEPKAPIFTFESCFKSFSVF
jgi:hypothetical protein